MSKVTFKHTPTAVPATTELTLPYYAKHKSIDRWVAITENLTLLQCSTYKYDGSTYVSSSPVSVDTVHTSGIMVEIFTEEYEPCTYDAFKTAWYGMLGGMSTNHTINAA